MAVPRTLESNGGQTLSVGERNFTVRGRSEEALGSLPKGKNFAEPRNGQVVLRSQKYGNIDQIHLNL